MLMKLLNRNRKVNHRENYMLGLPVKVNEIYTRLRDRIYLSMNGVKEQPRLLSITSCYKNEGVSTVSSNLSVKLSEQDNVLLIDGNIKYPRIHKIFKQKRVPGFIETLENGDSNILKVAPNIDLLEAGCINGVVPKKYESISILSAILNKYKKDYKYVIVDTPPIYDSSASIRIASLVDGVIIVVEANKTRWQAVQKAKEYLEQAHANIIGIVLNKRTFPIPRIFYRK